VQKLAPGFVLQATPENRHRPLRTRHIAAQALGHRRHAEAVLVVLSEDADAGQGTEETVERSGLCGSGVGKLLGVLRAVREQIGEFQLGSDVDGLGVPVAAHQVGKLVLG